MMSTYLPTIFGENLMDVFDDFDRSFFRGLNDAERMLYGKRGQNIMKTDVRETEDAYEVDVDLPGFRKEDIRLELNGGYLTITAGKNLEKNGEDGKGRMIRQERYAGVMQRSFYVGDQLTEEEIKASYADGVLHLILPRKNAPRVPEKKQILIEG